MPPLPSRLQPSSKTDTPRETKHRSAKSPARTPVSVGTERNGEAPDAQTAADVKPLDSATAVADWLAEANQRITSLFPSNVLNGDCEQAMYDVAEKNKGDTELQEGVIFPSELKTTDADDFDALAASYADDFHNEADNADLGSASCTESLRSLKRSKYPGDLDLEWVATNASDGEDYEDEFEDDEE